MPSHLSSISASFPSPTSSPILIDTAVIFLIQAAYYLLSKRFLLHALPTLRQISKRAPEEEQSGSDAGILGLPGLVEDRDEDDEGMINASGGLSDTGSISLSRPGGGSSGKRRETMDDVDDSDTDSILSYAVGSPSPAISGRPSMDEFPLLPLHATDSSQPGGSRHQRNTSLGIPAHPEALGKRLKEVKIRAPGVSGNGRRGIEPRKKVLRLFHGKRAREGDGDRVRTTKGLGWLARNLFSLCFSECLLLLTLVMFHSLGLLHSRSRRVHFSFSLHLLLLLILFVVPLTQCLLITYRSRDPAPGTGSAVTTTPSRKLGFSKRLLISMIPFGVYIFLFTRIPPYITESSYTSPTLALNATTDGMGGRNGTGRTGGGRIALPKHVHLGDYLDLDESEYPLDMDREEEEGGFEDEEGGGEQEDWQRGGWLEPSLGRVLVCGIIVMGGLSGFGAVRTAWNFYENGGLESGRPVSREDIIAAERALYRARHDIMSKREHLAQGTAPGGVIPHDSERMDDPGVSRWMNMFNGRNGGTGNEMGSLRRELQGLEMIENQTKRSLEAMKIRRKRQRFAQTIRGKIYNLIGIVFAFYCLARILMCLFSLFFPPLSTAHTSAHPRSGGSERTTPGETRSPGVMMDETLPSFDGKGNTNGDWISYVIALGLSQLPRGVVKDVNMWSRAISLLLTGLLILASLAQVLRSVARILRLTSKTVGAGFLLLGLSQLMSTYVISLLIQMRSYIPPTLTDPSLTNANGTLVDPLPDASHLNPSLDPFDPTSSSGPKDPSLLATLPDFRVFGRLFDGMFLLAAIGTCAWRWVGRRLSGVDEFGTVYQ